MVKNNNTEIPQWLPVHRCLVIWSNQYLICSYSYYSKWLEQNVRKQECYTINVNGESVLTWIPSRRERSVSIASRGESFPLSETQSCATNPQTGRQKEKGRACLVEEGDSKEAEKGKEQTRGVAYTQHWSDGGWEELKNPITYGGGREYAKQWKSQEPDIQPDWCKGVWLLCRYHPVPLKGQWIGLLPRCLTAKKYSNCKD